MNDTTAPKFQITANLNSNSTNLPDRYFTIGFNDVEVTQSHSTSGSDFGDKQASSQHQCFDQKSSFYTLPALKYHPSVPGNAIHDSFESKQVVRVRKYDLPNRSTCLLTDLSTDLTDDPAGVTDRRMTGSALFKEANEAFADDNSERIVSWIMGESHFGSARDSFELLLYRKAEARQMSIVSEVSLGLPLQRPDTPLSTGTDTDFLYHAALLVVAEPCYFSPPSYNALAPPNIPTRPYRPSGLSLSISTLPNPAVANSTRSPRLSSPFQRLLHTDSENIKKPFLIRMKDKVAAGYASLKNATFARQEIGRRNLNATSYLTSKVRSLSRKMSKRLPKQTQPARRYRKPGCFTVVKSATMGNFEKI